MTQEKLLQVLNEVGAVITNDHLVYTSGRHGSAYVNKDAIYPHVGLVETLCGQIVRHFSKDGIGVEYDVVAGPEKGGIILSQWTAYDSAHRWVQGKEILAVYAEKEGDVFVFRRGYEKLIPSQKVLIVEDVLTTGGSVSKVVDAVRKLGGEVVGVGALCNRGSVTAADIGGVPELYSILNISLESWPEYECPLCKQNVPINTSVGKGYEFLMRRPV